MMRGERHLAENQKRNDSAAQIVGRVEVAGGEFRLESGDERQPILRYRLGQAPQTIHGEIEAHLREIIEIQTYRAFLSMWQPPKGSSVQ